MKNFIKCVLKQWRNVLILFVLMIGLITVGVVGRLAYYTKLESDSYRECATVSTIEAAERICETRGGVKTITNDPEDEEMDVTCIDGSAFYNIKNH